MIIAIPIMLFARDVHYDRQHKIIIKQTIPVYSSLENMDQEVKPLFLINPDQTISVKRIRYGKSSMMIKIEDEKKNAGWILYGDEMLLIKPNDS